MKREIKQTSAVSSVCGPHHPLRGKTGMCTRENLYVYAWSTSGSARAERAE